MSSYKSTKTNVPPDELPIQPMQHSSFDLDVTPMRIHELALRSWLNAWFLLARGFPVPVMFTTPMNAFADFKTRWKKPDSPFRYLENLRDADGQPYYKHTENYRLPFITVKRIDWKYSPTRSFASKWYRKAGWPTLPDSQETDKATVYQTRMPQAWDYRVQLDHYAVRPETQAGFIHRLMQAMHFGQVAPYTWIPAVFPEFFGKKLLRVELESSVSDATEEEPDTQQRIYRTTVTLLIEGWSPDINYLEIPALWTVIFRGYDGVAMSPRDLELLSTSSKELRTYLDGALVHTKFKAYGNLETS